MASCTVQYTKNRMVEARKDAYRCVAKTRGAEVHERGARKSPNKGRGLPSFPSFFLACLLSPSLSALQCVGIGRRRLTHLPWHPLHAWPNCRPYRSRSAPAPRAGAYLRPATCQSVSVAHPSDLAPSPAGSARTYSCIRRSSGLHTVATRNKYAN